MSGVLALQQHSAPLGRNNAMVVVARLSSLSVLGTHVVHSEPV